MVDYRATELSFMGFGQWADDGVARRDLCVQTGTMPISPHCPAKECPRFLNNNFTGNSLFSFTIFSNGLQGLKS